MPGTDGPSSDDGNERIAPRSSRSQEPSALANHPTLSNTVTADPFLHCQFSHYRLEERLGVGGMGVLYRARDLNLRRSVAIKLLARHLAADEAAKARFVQEARAASALDHPNVATVYE